MKKAAALILTLSMTFSAVFAENVTIKYSGTAKPGELISFMAAKKGTDFADLSADDLARVEVVRAASDGIYEASLKLADVEYDENGKISNYILNSNIKNLDINDGTIDGEITLSKNEISVDKNGIVFVPLVSTMKRFGVEIAETSSGVYCGKGNNGDIEITIGKNTAEIDWVDIELPAPAKYENGVAMIPAYLLEDALRTEVPVYNEKNGTLRIKTPEEKEDEEEPFDIAKAAEELEGNIKQKSELSVMGGYSYDATDDAFTVLEKTADLDGDGKYYDDIKVTTLPYTYGNVPSLSARQFLLGTNVELLKGNVALITFNARATKITDESGTAPVSVSWQRRKNDYNSVCAEEINITGEWQKYYIPCYSADYDITSAYDPAIVFNVGGKPMTLEIADITVIKYDDAVKISSLRPETLKPYHGIETEEENGYDALWRKEAKRRIEKYRKGNTAIRVTDGSGNPVKGTKIKVNQTENDFMFGVSVVKDEIIGIDETSSPGSIQADVINNSFNTTVCGLEMKPFYVGEDDGIDGILMSNEFFRRHKRMRGHTLVWDQEGLWPFENYKNMSYEELYRNIMNYVRPMAYTFRGKLAQWDVLNEPHDSNWIRTRYGTRLYSDVFKEVHKIDPDVKLYVNETGIEGRKNKNIHDRVPRLLEIVEQMKSEGAPIDGIGIQAHCLNYYYPQGFYHQLDECASIVDEVAVTEYDFKNENEEYAPQHLRDTLLATFSHPKATAFVMWGFQDTMHWRNSAPFYDSAWNEKPAKKMWDSMVNDEFKTKTEIETDENGNAYFRGFYGDYEITVETESELSKSFEYSLIKNGENKININIGENGISEQVSAVPGGDIMPIEYENVKAAGEELENSEEWSYSGIVLEADFKGAADSDAVKNGISQETKEDFEKGNIWGSYMGLNGFLKNTDKGIVALADSAGGGDLRRRINGSVLKGSDVEISCSFNTLDASSDFKAELFVENTEENYVACIGYESGGYYLSTINENKISLEKNSRYELKILLSKGKIRYTLCESGTPISDFEEKNDISYISDICGEIIKLSCDGSDGGELLELINSRMKFTLYNPLFEFEKLNYEHTALNENMYNFSLNNISDKSDGGYINGNSWAGNSLSLTNGFEYKTYQKYLWAVRADNRELFELSHRFNPPKPKETLALEFDMELYALSWYDGNGGAGISLYNDETGKEIPVVCVNYNQYGYKGSLGNGFDVGFIIRMLNLAESDTNNILAVSTGPKNALNRNKLHAVLTLSPNENGSYNAKLVLKNENDGEYVCEKENFIADGDFCGINALKFYSKTDSVANGKNIGSCVLGLKNIKVLKSGLNAEKDFENGYIFKSGENVCIDYENITQGKFSISVILAGYKNGALSETDIREFEAGKEKEGSINIKLPIGGSDYYKLFIMKDSETLLPLRAADKITLE